MPHKMLHNEPQKVWSHHRVTLSMFAFCRKHSYIPRHCYCCKGTSVFNQALDSEAGVCATGDGGHSWDTGDTGDTGEKGDTRDTGLTGTTVLRLEIKPKNTVKSFEICFKKFWKGFNNWVDWADWADRDKDQALEEFKKVKLSEKSFKNWNHEWLTLLLTYRTQS